MKKYYFLIIVALILGLVLTGCSLLSNIGQAPATDQSGVTYLTKGLPSSLVGWWRFNEDATDSSDNSNDGTVTGGATYVASPMGHALTFDGVVNYVGCGNDTSLNITNAITIEAWVKPSGFLTNPDYSTIATKALAYYFQVDVNGYLGVYQYGTNPVGYHSSNNPISLDVWQHVAYTYDGSNVRMFINGVLDKTIPVTGTIQVSNKHLGIGMNLDASGNPYPNFYRQFRGEIDEVRIWNRALDASELIRYGFKGLLPPYAPPSQKMFKLGSTVPLKWQYTYPAGNVVDSAGASPTVGWVYTGLGIDTTGILADVDAPGASGLQYDALTKTWQFNWQTKDRQLGIYNITITSGQTLQVFGPFEIQLK
ncbi:MAG: LamG domain-containing protein [Bacteroidetes bacterium]|nr:LamG domain-containing protein [Bacteroidota bacterium]